MPVFEYKCSDCDTKFDYLHKSSVKIDDVNCPKCNSTNNKKLLSSFSASVSSGYSYSGGCSDGSCSVPAPTGGCASGLCGLN
ncbi:MAG: zinc ribbon domain-containing protein [Ignavibacteriales bacterium]|nr:zinc ribbon domain-containing protein [Ignavibacteriales bacterium]MCF8316697.1 zinc ribbon domain-containing protein [Ignavibacteriales bacterium]MCF8438345.1 zinc ribbon domain-containing protein [Ignavibacteriales bacterium]